MIASPAGDPDRVESIDALRGFAVLGILLMNVQSFAMPEAAYINPTAYGRLDGANGWAWLVSHVLADRKFMAIFSMLFGAGILLFTRRAEARGDSPVRLHVRRMLWLVVFGLAHAYLLWYGDILVAYGICGLLAYPLRHLRPGRRFVLGLALLAVASGLALAEGDQGRLDSEELGHLQAVRQRARDQAELVLLGPRAARGVDGDCVVGADVAVRQRRFEEREGL